MEPGSAFRGLPRGGKGAAIGGLALPKCTLKKPSGYFPNSFGETVWKFSATSHSPHHQPNHGCVHKRFRAGTQPLVVLAHPSVLAKPGEGPLHNPATR